MKSLGEILFNYREDPDKETLRQRLNTAARDWEEADPHAAPLAAAPGPRDLPAAEVAPGEDLQPLRRRLLAALPQLDAAQRRMLETLLDSWGV